MMLGEGGPQHHPTVHVPPWSLLDNGGILCGDYSCASASPVFLNEALAALQHYLPSNDPELDESDFPDSLGRGVESDVYSSDEFRMYEFKVKRCARGRSHDWTECPFAHPGEKARRRDPRKFHYSGAACPDFRKGSCKRGDACEFAHGVFECWLHPARYRTQPCKDGTSCRRRVCFFAHTPDQLRVLPHHHTPHSAISASPASPKLESYDGSPLRSYFHASKHSLATSPTSTLLSPPVSPPSDSPPLSPVNTTAALRRSLQANSTNQVLASLRQLQLNKSGSLPSSWALPHHFGSPKLASPAASLFRSLPSTPTGPSTRYFDSWESPSAEGVTMERVESGRDLRAKIFQRLSLENKLCDKAEIDSARSDAPDVGWISDLIM